MQFLNISTFQQMRTCRFCICGATLSTNYWHEKDHVENDHLSSYIYWISTKTPVCVLCLMRKWMQEVKKWRRKRRKWQFGVIQFGEKKFQGATTRRLEVGCDKSFGWWARGMTWHPWSWKEWNLCGSKSNLFVSQERRFHWEYTKLALFSWILTSIMIIIESD